MIAKECEISASGYMEGLSVRHYVEHTCSVFDHELEYEPRNLCTPAIELEDYDSGDGNHDNYYGRAEYAEKD